MKVKFSWQVLEKFSNIKFHQLHPVEDEFFHTDEWGAGRQTDTLTKILQLILGSYRTDLIGSYVSIHELLYEEKWKTT